LLLLHFSDKSAIRDTYPQWWNSTLIIWNCLTARWQSWKTLLESIIRF
jgi:hypothetical protein